MTRYLSTAAPALFCLAWISSASGTPSSGRGTGSSNLSFPPHLQSSAAASTVPKPKLTITTSHGDSGLSPVLTWSTSQRSKDGKYKYDLGLDMEPLRGESFNAATNVFGRISTKLKRTVGGAAEAANQKGAEGIVSRLLKRKSTWGVSFRADVNVRNLPNIDTCDLAMEANCEERDINLKTYATVHEGHHVEMRHIDVSKTYRSMSNGRLTINPRYYFPSHSGTGYVDAIMTYDRDDVDTSVQLYANREFQRLTIARKVGDDVIISPSISSSGNINVQWHHNIGDSSVIANFSPRENINVKWTDGSVGLNIEVPIVNGNIESTKVSLRKKIQFGCAE